MKLTNCKYCNINFENLTPSETANHSRWCKLNPNAKKSRDNLAHARSFVKYTDVMRDKISTAHKNGKYDYSKLKGRHFKHTEDSKRKISVAALKSKHRRLLKSVRKYTMMDGSTVLLDSSWEELLARRLDYLKIQWERPLIPVEWIDKNQIRHNYFPDFYLPKFNIFLDPKNPYAVSRQKEKLEIILKIMPNLFLLKTENECKQFNIENYASITTPH